MGSRFKTSNRFSIKALSFQSQVVCILDLCCWRTLPSGGITQGDVLPLFDEFPNPSEAEAAFFLISYQLIFVYYCAVLTVTSLIIIIITVYLIIYRVWADKCNVAAALPERRMTCLLFAPKVNSLLQNTDTHVGECVKVNSTTCNREL